MQSLKRLPRFFHGNHSNPESNLQSISKMPFFNSYRKAVNLSLTHQYQQSISHYKQALQQIKEAKQDSLQHYIEILRRIASSYYKLGRNKATEDTLYEIIKHKKKSSVNPVLIYNEYNTLFAHLLRYDLSKAILLGKALLNPREAKDIPISHIKMFGFNLANAYLLEGNYPDAKKRFWECLQSEPNHTLKSLVLNNLGIACWWHKNPMFSSDSQYRDYQNSSIDKEFKQAKDLLQSSILQAEDLPTIGSQERRLLLEQTLNQNKINQSVTFEKPESILPMKNLAQFLIHNDPINKSEILFWCQKTLKLSKQLKKDKQFDRTLIHMSILTADSQLQTNLDNLIEKYKNSLDQAYYRRLRSRIFARKSQHSEALEHQRKAASISSKYPQWQNKLDYIKIFDLQL